MLRTSPSRSPFGLCENRICAVAACGTAEEMKRQIRQGLQETSTIELRLDWLENDAERRELLGWLGKQSFEEATFIATCRRRVAGGGVKGDIQAQVFCAEGGGGCGC